MPRIIAGRLAITALLLLSTLTHNAGHYGSGKASSCCC